MNKNVIYAALMFVVTMSSGKASAQQLPYQNPALSAHERAVDLCGRLTLEEKASLMLDDSDHHHESVTDSRRSCLHLLHH